MNSTEPASNTDGTFTVPGRAEGPGGAIGDGMITIGPDHPAYPAWDRYLSRVKKLDRDAPDTEETITAQLARPADEDPVAELADDETATLGVQVTGPAEQVDRFAQLCKTIGSLCSAGASRTVQIDVDGDGDAGLRFEFTPDGAADSAQVADFDSDPVRVPGIGG